MPTLVTMLTGSGENGTNTASKVHNSSDEKRNAPNQDRGPNRRRSDNNNECHKGYAESEMTMMITMILLLCPLVLVLNFTLMTKGTPLGGNLILGSIVMHIW